jgi:drug/metabolite transporter (DMT)-like permease
LVLGLALGFGGVLFLTEPAKLLPGESMDVLGTVVVLLSATSWAVGTIVSRRIPVPQSSILFSGMNLLAGGAPLILVGF